MEQFFLDAETGRGVALGIDVHAKHTLATRAEISAQIDHGGGFSHAAFLVRYCIHHTHAVFSFPAVCRTWDFSPFFPERTEFG